MAIRYVVVMTLVPEMRWFHGTIPIFFHFVLAGYIYTLTLDSRTPASPEVRTNVRAA